MSRTRHFLDGVSLKSETIRPLLSAMQDPQDLDPATFDTVGGEEGSADNNQFPGALDSALIGQVGGAQVSWLPAAQFRHLVRWRLSAAIKSTVESKSRCAAGKLR